MNQVIIAFGSNIDKEHNLPRGVNLLGELCHITAVSQVYETVPVGLRDQPNFLNAAVCVETELGPRQLKDTVLQRLEEHLQRRRQEDRNAPRTFDADIVLFNDEVLDYEGGDGRSRHIPDPDLCRFPHVTVPVADLVPDMRHPETGERFTDLANRLVTAETAEQGQAPLWPRTDIDLSSAIS